MFSQINSYSKILGTDSLCEGILSLVGNKQSIGKHLLIQHPHCVMQFQENDNVDLQKEEIRDRLCDRNVEQNQTDEIDGSRCDREKAQHLAEMEESLCDDHGELLLHESTGESHTHVNYRVMKFT